MGRRAWQGKGIAGHDAAEAKQREADAAAEEKSVTAQSMAVQRRSMEAQ